MTTRRFFLEKIRSFQYGSIFAGSSEGRIINSSRPVKSSVSIGNDVCEFKGNV